MSGEGTSGRLPVDYSFLVRARGGRRDDDTKTLDQVRELLATHPALANSTGLALSYVPDGRSPNVVGRSSVTTLVPRPINFPHRVGLAATTATESRTTHEEISDRGSSHSGWPPGFWFHIDGHRASGQRGTMR